MGDHNEKNQKRAHLDDYQKTAEGGYVYTGPTCAWASPRKKSLGLMWLWAVLAFGAAVAAGCLPDTGMEDRPWVLLPYAGTLALSGVQCWLMYRLTSEGDTMRDHVWKTTVGRLPGVGLVAAIFAGGTVIGELICVLLPAFGGCAGMAVLFMGSEVVVLVASLCLRMTISRLEWA